MIARKYATILVVCLLFSCQDSRDPNTSISNIDLPQIKQRQKLYALTGYSATSYFIYKGRPMGYEYELLTRLADHLGLELEILIEDNLEQLFRRLNKGESDIIAYGLTITGDRKDLVKFTDYLFTTRQVLVQRKPDKWKQMKLHEIDEKLVRSPLQLIGKKVQVKKASSYEERLKNLSEEIGGKIDVIEAGGDSTTEQLMEAVSTGKIDYTVADQHIALINQAYYQNLDVQTPLSLPQRIAWAVRKKSPKLLNEVNDWIRKMKKETDYYVIYNKYFKNRRAFVHRAKSPYFSVTGGRISEYDDILKEQSKILDWDWRLLASLIYQESQFRNNASSWTGAVGLMQLLPHIGHEFGAKNLRNPRENIRAGVEYLHWLDVYWQDQINDHDERIKFVLASYNVGLGHVQDARRLAEKYGKSAIIWTDSVEKYIVLLSEEKYYNDELVEFGYCQGLEPYNYVREILDRYRKYLETIIE